MKADASGSAFRRSVLIGGLALVLVTAIAVLMNIAGGQTLVCPPLTCENVDDDIAEIVEQMDDLGYSVVGGNFELYDPETSNVYIPFAQDDVDYLISVFEDGTSAVRLGGQDVVLFRGCTPPDLRVCTPAITSHFFYQHSSAFRIEDLDLDGNIVDFTLLEASLGDPAHRGTVLTEENPFTVYPSPSDRKVNVAVTGDLQTFSDLVSAYDNADLDESSLNLLGIPDDWFLFSPGDLSQERVPANTIICTFEVATDGSGDISDWRISLREAPFPGPGAPVQTLDSLGPTGLEPLKDFASESPAGAAACDSLTSPTFSGSSSVGSWTTSSPTEHLFTGEPFTTASSPYRVGNLVKGSITLTGPLSPSMPLSDISGQLSGFTIVVSSTPRDTLTLIQTLDWGSNEIPSGVKEQYLNQSFPFRVFYKTDPQPREPIDLNLRSTTPSAPQIAAKKEFQRPFNQMVRRIKDHFVGLGMQFVSDTRFVTNSDTLNGDPVPLFDYGIACINDQVDCMFDTPLTYYAWDRRFHTLDDDYFVLVGVDHAELGAVDYNKIGIYAVTNPDNGNAFEQIDGYPVPKLVEDYSITDVISLPASQQEVAGKSFMLQVSRPDNCIGGIAAICPNNDILALGQDFMFRGDLTSNPETDTRPDRRQVIPWRLLHFTVP